MTRLNALATYSAASLAALGAAGAIHAAALEQTVPATIRLLSHEGRYLEFNLAFTSPHQDGSGVTIPPNPIGIPPGTYPGSTGNMLEDRWTFGGAWKDDITDKLSYALIVDQPLMADTSFGPGTFPFQTSLYGGSSADLKTFQITGALAYEVTPNVTLYGGLRAQQLDASAALSFVFDYSVDAERKWGYGYLLGASYQIPEYALRVALTYHSKISYDLDTTETSSITGAPLSNQTSTDVDTPQSVTLEAQTGIDPKTLVFGSIRWVDWSEFEISPPDYEVAINALIGQSRPLVDYQDDWWTYTLGVGRQLTDTLAGSLSISYEPSVGGEMTTLGPYDGRTVGTAALTYEMGQIEITGGLSYGVLGDTFNVLGTDFDDGSVWGAGLRIGYTF